MKPQIVTKRCYWFHFLVERPRLSFLFYFPASCCLASRNVLVTDLSLMFGANGVSGHLWTHTLVAVSSCPSTVKKVGRNILSLARGGTDTFGCQSGVRRPPCCHCRLVNTCFIVPFPNLSSKDIGTIQMDSKVPSTVAKLPLSAEHWCREVKITQALSMSWWPGSSLDVIFLFFLFKFWYFCSFVMVLLQ